MSPARLPRCLALAAFVGAGAVSPVLAMELGVDMSAGEAVDKAIKNKATKEEILEAANLGFAPGITEAIPLEMLFNKVPLGKWGKLIDALVRIGMNYVAEGGQEMLQQFMQNVIAKYVYKPDQDLTEGLQEPGSMVVPVALLPRRSPHHSSGARATRMCQKRRGRSRRSRDAGSGPTRHTARSRAGRSRPGRGYSPAGTRTDHGTASGTLADDAGKHRGR